MGDSPRNLQDARRLLFLNFNKIGDTLLQTQLFRALKTARPDVRITVLASPVAAEILKGNPDVDRLEPTALLPERSLAEFVRYRALCSKLIREEGIEALVCDSVNSNPVTALLLHSLRVRWRIYTGAARKRWYAPLLSGFSGLTRVGAEYGIDEPVRFQNRRLAAALGGDPAQARVRFVCSREERAKGEAFVRALRERAGPGTRLIAFAPFSANEAATWPMAHALEWTRLAVENGWVVAVFGTPTEAGEFAERAQGRVVVSGLELREGFAAILHFDLLICLDSGPSHLFECLDGVPLLRLDSFKTPAETWGYAGEPGYRYIQKKVPCGPCRSSCCREPGHPCMAGITPAEVLAEARSALERGEKPGVLPQFPGPS